MARAGIVGEERFSKAQSRSRDKKGVLLEQAERSVPA
jgi:hypothetical protein